MASPRRKEVTFAPVQVRTPWFTVFTALILVVALIPPALYAYEAYGYSRFEYRVTPEGVRARYGLTDIRVPAGEIARAALVENPGRLSRTAGTGLPEIQRGWWNSSEYGRVYRLTTTGRDLVLIETTPDASTARPGTRYLFSPADPEDFVRLVDAVREGDAAGAGLEPAGRSFPPAAGSGRSPGANPVMLMVLFEAPLVGAIVWLVIRGRRSLLYRVDAEGIGVRHLFGWHRFRWDRIREVRRVDRVKAFRVMGAALPGYYAGSFRARELGGVQVYATDLRGPTVLIDRVGGPKVLISPADIDRFLEGVARYRPA